MWPDFRLSELLGIRHPIIQAPMKGASTPELAAAVSNAGGLGSLGCSGLSAADLSALLARMREITNGPVNANFFATPAARPDPATLAAVRQRLAPHYARLGLGDPPATIAPEPAPFTDETLDILLASPPTVVSFHFGLPPGDAVARLQYAGARILATATTVTEARALEAAGIDAIIAQGWEAGGHRGTFTTESIDTGTGLFALLPQIVDAVSLPVIAAGGIADGRGIAAAFLLGASGVQLGTAFLSTPEVALPAAYRARLDAATDTSTRLTRARSGRPCRVHRTAFTDDMADAPTLDFPLMYPLSGPLHTSGDPDCQIHLYGQSAALNRALPAGKLFDTLVREAQTLLAPGPLAAASRARDPIAADPLAPASPAPGR